MWEFLPVGAMDKSKLSIFLTSWVDKFSLCMYTMGQIHIWLVPHLKASCQYIDCGKIYCPVQEEDVRKACETANSKGATIGIDNVQEKEDEVEVDINLLLEKEKKKILKQRERNAQKAKDKAEKKVKKDKRASKSKAVATSSFPPLLTKTSTTTSSQNPRKQDASVVQLSMSRLQQIILPALMDFAGINVIILEYWIFTKKINLYRNFFKISIFGENWNLLPWIQKTFQPS